MAESGGASFASTLWAAHDLLSGLSLASCCQSLLIPCGLPVPVTPVPKGKEPLALWLLALSAALSHVQGGDGDPKGHTLPAGISAWGSSICECPVVLSEGIFCCQ